MALSKNKLKYLRSLRQKKYRQMYNKFVAEGDKLTREILVGQHPVEWVVATAEWWQKNPVSIPEEKCLVVSDRELTQISNLKTPQGVLVVAECLPEPSPPWLSRSSWALYLDTIQDPGNLGTILRIADWFGIGPVILSPATAEEYNPKVVQAAMGAVWRVPILRRSLEMVIEEHPDVPVYAADMSGTSVFAQSWEPGLLVIGNEGRGVSAEWEPAITQYLSIPRGSGGEAESLNAAVACGILVAALTVQK